MQIETLMFVGWASVPVIAYVMSRVALRHSARLSTQRPAVDAVARLQQIRERPVEGTITRGRMTEAIRLAEGAGLQSQPLRRV